MLDNNSNEHSPGMSSLRSPHHAFAVESDIEHESDLRDEEREEVKPLEKGAAIRKM
jgi:hypothetical protein